MRSTPRFARVAPLWFLAACAAVQVPGDAEREAPVEDTQRRTLSGATFVVPSGWFLTEHGDHFTLEDPERELRLTLLELPGPSAEAAVRDAWQKAEPGFARPVLQSLRPPPRDGWDELSQVSYETGAQQARRVLALARRVGGTNYVALLDGTSAAVDRRGAQVNQVVLGFKPPSLGEESFAGRSPRSLSPERFEALGAFVEQTRMQVGIPGVALAVVQDGRVVYARGFGVREQGSKEPVTTETLFLIGSTTKSLTTLMMARLVDQGRLAWDTPVTRLLPTFALADAEVTSALTLKDTVCACTGLPRQDMEMLFEFAGVSAEQRIAELGGMRPTTGVGETFQYSNPMVSAGGYMAAHAYAPEFPLEQAYDRAMRALVFDALGMKATTFDFGKALRGNHASPHGQRLTREYSPVPVSAEAALVPVRPAGGAWSNVRELSRYVLLELSEGRLPGGKRLVTAENLLERRQPRVKASDTVSYGLGLFAGDDHGVRVVGHGGNTLGFSSDLFFLPEAGVGAVLLTNVQGDSTFRNAVRRKLLELLYDGRDVAREQLEFALLAQREAAEKQLSRLKPEADAAWLAGLAGSYRHPGLGPITLEVEGASAVVDAGEWRSAVGEKVEPDGTRKLVLLDAPMAGLELLPRQEGGRTVLALELPQQRYVFEPEKTRAADSR
ncbi:MAG: beta-lactamase family protein [Myxococcaceae bacterium]|nr:beta-lactamase family protein [Myxococcaceae bacterium]MCI0672446.1 beta-lactamase family protein [Myxococcaceae bacterium]